MRILAESLQIRRHRQLYSLLQGEVQAFLPHDVLISVCGDFSDRADAELNVDIVSRLPGVRTSNLSHCSVGTFIRAVRTQWHSSQRLPTVFPVENVADTLRGNCACAMHVSFRAMRYVSVHGIQDERGKQESIYVTLRSEAVDLENQQERFDRVADALVALLDMAFRRIEPLQLAIPRRGRDLGVDWLDLSDRERQILSLVCSGKTNGEIAEELSISHFTVKNHVQRIFRKLDVSNRTEAAAKYYDAQRALAA